MGSPGLLLSAIGWGLLLTSGKEMSFDNEQQQKTTILISSAQTLTLIWTWNQLINYNSF
jgi:hypothetical protein